MWQITFQEGVLNGKCNRQNIKMKNDSSEKIKKYKKYLGGSNLINDVSTVIITSCELFLNVKKYAEFKMLQQTHFMLHNLRNIIMNDWNVNGRAGGFLQFCVPKLILMFIYCRYGQSSTVPTLHTGLNYFSCVSLGGYFLVLSVSKVYSAKL
jgi:hypothetical protein